MTASGHIPVMLAEVVAATAPAPGAIIVDGTFGAGGYSRAFLDAADCQVIAIDRDPDAADRAQGFAADFGARFHFVAGAFGDMDSLLDAQAVDAIVLDIGVSSFQIDEAERGFSFLRDGPLDMRMSQHGESAADIVNSWGEADLADLIYRFGEERKSRRIAAAIVTDRREKPFERTLELASLIERVVGYPKGQGRGKGIHPATRTFQALRIKVNDELGELERGLRAAEALLKPGGRLVVVTFHSLEDRLVKTFMAERAGRTPAGSRHRPSAIGAPAASFTLPKPHLVKATKTEATQNPRARSAKMRVAIRTDAPGWRDAA